MHAGLPLSAQANSITVIHSCRNFDGQGLGFISAAAPVADMTGVFNLLASALTARAGLLHREKSLLHTYLTVTTAGRTVNRLRTGRGTAAIAVLAGHGGRYTNLNRGAPDSTLKIKL